MLNASTDIRISNLKLSYGAKFCLGPYTTQLNTGDCVAILGKNGAGKSSFFQCITGNIELSSGEIEWIDGNKKQKLTVENSTLKKQIGYLPQHHALPQWSTVRELLTYAAQLYGMQNYQSIIDATLQYWDCISFADKALAACSLGMQKRAGLALSSFHAPKLLVLDEPFSGLDVYHIRALENLIVSRAQSQGITLLSTHVLPYASRYCNRALFIEDGKIEEIKEWSSVLAPKREELMDLLFFPAIKV